MATTRSWPRSTRARDGRQADGPASEHGDALSGLDVRLVGGAHADSQGLRERRHVERQVAGDTVEPGAVGVGDEEERCESPLRGAVADPTQFVVARLHDDAVAGAGDRDVGPDPVDDARHLVAEAHRAVARTGEPAHLDVREVATADAAGRDVDNDVAGARFRFRDIVDTDVTGPVDANLVHRVSSVNRRRD